jgi:ABC-type glycerol-3-phosphate transport system substrate-binding protein
MPGNRSPLSQAALGTLLLLAVSFALLGGCSRSSGPVVSFMVFGGPEELAAYESLVDAFHQAQAEVGVELRYVPDLAEYRRRLAADFSASTAPM